MAVTFTTPSGPSDEAYVYQFVSGGSAWGEGDIAFRVRFTFDGSGGEIIEDYDLLLDGTPITGTVYLDVLSENSRDLLFRYADNLLWSGTSGGSHTYSFTVTTSTDTYNQTQRTFSTILPVCTSPVEETWETNEFTFSYDLGAAQLYSATLYVDGSSKGTTNYGISSGKYSGSETISMSGAAWDLLDSGSHTWRVDVKVDSSYSQIYPSDTVNWTKEGETEVEVSATIAGTGTITLNREGLPGAPTNPSPADTATSVNLSTGFSWTNGANTDTTALHMDFGDGYFEVASGLESAAYSLAQDLFDYGWNVTWKILASNDYGTTVGPEWTFTALEIDPPYPSWEPIEGGSGEGPGTGVEGTDFLYSGRNNVITSANLVAIANNRLWYSSWS